MTSLTAADWSAPCPKCGHLYNLHFGIAGTDERARRGDAACMACECEVRGDDLPPRPANTDDEDD